VTEKFVVVVGGGPAGMMSAIRAGQLGCKVLLYEKKSSLGHKLLLTGNGRCNLTNTADLDTFLSRFFSNGDFLRDAFKKFFNKDLMRFFEESGLRLKVERQNRVFPVTDSSRSVLRILEKRLKESNVEIFFNSRVKSILTSSNSVEGIMLDNGTRVACKAVVLATGGMSYAFTGSSGDGYEIARQLGHKIVPLRPGLVALKIKGDIFRLLEGLTLKNIRLTFNAEKESLTTDIGELLFTSFGISGPLVFSASGKVVDWLREKKPVVANIDLKPALSLQQLDARLLRDFKASSRKHIKNVLKQLLPNRLINVFLRVAEINSETKVNQVNRLQRMRLVRLCKEFSLDVLDSLPIEEAMITRGGVSLKEINPKTMESRLVKGLYFAGEIIDVDADTGGFNLQAAFSTGFLAGESAALN